MKTCCGALVQRRGTYSIPSLQLLLEGWLPPPSLWNGIENGFYNCHCRRTSQRIAVDVNCMKIGCRGGREEWLVAAAVMIGRARREIGAENNNIRRFKLPVRLLHSGHDLFLITLESLLRSMRQHAIHLNDWLRAQLVPTNK